MMTVKLYTGNLAIPLDREFRSQLIDNFTQIQDSLNEISVNQAIILKKMDKLPNVAAINGLATSADIKNLSTRINRIVLGTDNQMIEQVVTQILKDKGVID